MNGPILSQVTPNGAIEDPAIVTANMFPADIYLKLSTLVYAVEAIGKKSFYGPCLEDYLRVLSIAGMQLEGGSITRPDESAMQKLRDDHASMPRAFPIIVNWYWDIHCSHLKRLAQEPPSKKRAGVLRDMANVMSVLSQLTTVALG